MSAFSFHSARRDRVDTDLARRQFGSQHTRDRVHRAFGRGIDHGVGNGGGADDRADVDHASAFRPEVFQRFLNRQDRTQDVGVELAVEFVFGDRLEWVEGEDAGVVDQHVWRAEGPLCFREQALHIGELRDVALDRDRLSAFTGNFRNHAVRALLAGGVVHHYRSARLGHAFGDSRANALRRAGYDRYFALEFAHFSTPVDTSSI